MAAATTYSAPLARSRAQAWSASPPHTNYTQFWQHGFKELTICRLCSGRLLAYSHVYKAAGSSAVSVLVNGCRSLACPRDRRIICVTDHASCGPYASVFNQTIHIRTRLPAPNSLEDIRRQNPRLADELMSSRTVWFATVREPLARFESAVREAANRCELGHHERLYMSAKEVSNCSEITCSWALSSASRVRLPLLSQEHFLPQWTFLQWPNGPSKLPLDYIFLSDEMDQVVELVKFYTNTTVPSLSRGARAPRAPRLHSLNSELGRTSCLSLGWRVRKLYWSDYSGIKGLSYTSTSTS